MNLAIFSHEGLIYGLRWFHYFFGVTWIGLLYYFNFVQTPFMGDAATDATTKSGVTRILVPKALFYFRWAAMFTFLTGLSIFMLNGYHHMIHSGLGLAITTGITLGILMFANVWLIIWPNQKVVIANAVNVAAGQPANPDVAKHAARAALASRTNVLFSLPMLFFMGAGRFLNWQVQDNINVYLGAFLLIVAIIEINAIKGKMVKPLSTVRGVVHSSFALWVIIYLMFEFLAVARV